MKSRPRLWAVPMGNNRISMIDFKGDAGCSEPGHGIPPAGISLSRLDREAALKNCAGIA